MLKQKVKPREHDERITLLNLKISEKDKRALQAQAKKYANGNVSAWLRFAGVRFKPVLVK